jgi:hypothetical protein
MGLPHRFRIVNRLRNRWYTDNLFGPSLQIFVLEVMNYSIEKGTDCEAFD